MFLWVFAPPFWVENALVYSLEFRRRRNGDATVALPAMIYKPRVYFIIYLGFVQEEIWMNGGIPSVRREAHNEPSPLGKAD